MAFQRQALSYQITVNQYPVHRRHQVTLLHQQLESILKENRIHLLKQDLQNLEKALQPVLMRHYQKTSTHQSMLHLLFLVNRQAAHPLQVQHQIDHR